MDFSKSKIDSKSPTPIGSFFAYECTLCGEILDSVQKNAAACKCRNLIVDSDAGRISIKKYDHVLLLKKEI